MLRFEYDEDEIKNLLKGIGLEVLGIETITWDAYKCMSIDAQVLSNFEFVESSIENQIDYIHEQLMFNGSLSISKIHVIEKKLKA